MPVYGLSEEMQARIAADLYQAEKTVTPINLPSKEYPVLTFADAYAIQQKGLEMRLAEGARVVGRKIGITSEGMMKMLRCTSPDYGYLLAHTQIPENGACICSELHMPFIEGELAFVMGKTLNKAPVTEQDVIDATAYVVPGFEICDTRFPDWNITVRDTICDNAACAYFMIGTHPQKVTDIDPASISMVMEKNGEVLRSATGSEVMGSPVNSITWLANKLLEYGDCLIQGDIVLSGSFIAGDLVEVGDTYRITMGTFPPLKIDFV